MFCKWCGGNLTASDTKCKRCGKEVPALSDCGGFYDIVPNARGGNTAAPAPAPMPVPAGADSYYSPRGPQQTKKKGISKKQLTNLTAFTAVGFVVLLIMLFAMQIKVNRLRREVEKLQESLVNLQDDAQQDGLPWFVEEPEEADDEATSPDEAKSEEITPEATASDETAPEETTEETKPDKTAEEDTKPDPTEAPAGPTSAPTTEPPADSSAEPPTDSSSEFFT